MLEIGRAGGLLQIQHWRTRHPTRGRRHQGRLPGGGDAAAVHYPWEEKRVLQAKRQRVRLAKERLPHNRVTPPWKDPEDGIVGLEDVARGDSELAFSDSCVPHGQTQQD